MFSCCFPLRRLGPELILLTAGCLLTGVALFTDVWVLWQCCFTEPLESSVETNFTTLIPTPFLAPITLQRQSLRWSRETRNTSFSKVAPRCRGHILTFYISFQGQFLLRMIIIPHVSALSSFSGGVHSFILICPSYLHALILICILICTSYIIPHASA